MSAIDELRKNLGTAQPLNADLNKKGTSQPDTPAKGGSAVETLRANLNTPAVAPTPQAPTSEPKGVFASYSDKVNRGIASFDAGFVQSVGQLSRSFQWLGDRLVGDRLVQNASDKVLESELKSTDDMLKIYRDRKARGDEEGAQTILDQLKVMSKNDVKYEAYADTTDSIFYKAQDKTKAWGDALKAEAGVTDENQTFAEKVFEGAGSSATYFIPSLGVAKGASILAKVSPRIAMLFGGSTMASLEAMAEAGSTFDEWKKKGDLQKAGEESSKVFLANAILLTVSNQLGIFNPAKLGILKRALISAPVEGLQEAVQQMIQNEANDRPLWEGVVEAGAIGAIIGSVMGGVTDIVTTQTVESEEKKKKTPTSPALDALRETLQVTPAIEQQKEIEKTTVPTPREPVVVVPPTAKVDGKIPTFSQAEKLINREGGFSKASSLPAMNRMDAEQLGESLGFNAKFLYTQATKQDIKLRDWLQRLDGETDPQKRTAIGAELMETLAKPDEVEAEGEVETVKEERTTPLWTNTAGIEQATGKKKAKVGDAITYNGREWTVGTVLEMAKGDVKYELVPVNKSEKNEPKEADDTKKPINSEIEAEKKYSIKEDAEVGFVAREKKDGKNIVLGTFSTREKAQEYIDSQAKTVENVTERYWSEVIQPRIENGEAVIIGADDLKDFFGKDYDDANHPIYSKSAFNLYERALKDAEGDVIFIGGGAGSGKTEILVETLVDSGFTGIIYDSNLASLEGAKKQIAMAKADGRDVAVYGITPNLESARTFTILRENEKGRGIADSTFARGHAGFPKVVEGLITEKVLPQKSVKLIDTRGQVSKADAIEMVRNGTFVRRPLDFVQKLGYTENYVKETYAKDSFSQTSGKRLQGQEVRTETRESPRKGGADKEVTPKDELRLELQEKPDAKEKEGTTEVRGEEVPRYGFDRRFGSAGLKPMLKKPILTKTDLKTILKYTPELKENPVLTVEMEEVGTLMRPLLTFRGKSTQFEIKANALGLTEDSLKAGDQVRISIESLSRSGNEFRVIKYDENGAGSKYASAGRYRDDTEIFLRNPEQIKPIQFPELVRLATELSGNVPFIKKYTKANGMFYPKGTGEIGLNPSLFSRENLGQLTKTLAHEIGHLTDYLPDQTMTRGNLLGRLMTLRNFRNDFLAEAGQSRTDTELREQMYKLSVYWRPYEEATAKPSFIAYRKSAPEVYADFISALFNDPRLVSDMAPTAYNLFFEHLDRKPNVKEAYFELQSLLRTGDVIASRRSATTAMFKVTEQESKERQIQEQIEQEERERSIWFKFKTEFVDLTEVVKEDVKKAQEEGNTINPDDNPTYYLEERNYIGGKVKAQVDTKFNTIYQELQKEGLTWEDLGELMMYERILKGDRQEVANPLGYQPDFVQELMDVYEDVGQVKADPSAHAQSTSDMKTTLGEAKYSKLQALAVQYRENLKSFFEEGLAEGIYSEELGQLFEDNAFYVPFKGAKYSGVTRTTFGVKAQKGTLGNIENPANTGIEKAVSIIRAIERNRVTRKTIEFYQQFYPEEVTEAKTDKNGYPIDPRESHLGLVTYMEEGKVKGYYVDKYIEQAIKKVPAGQLNSGIKLLRFFNSGLYRPLFITFNLGFQTFNLIRDMKRFWKNVPDMTLLKTMKLYGESVRASKIRAFGLPENPSEADLEAYDLINRLENEQIISITYNDIIKGENIEDAQIDRILREVGVREAEPTKLGMLGEKVGLTRQSPLIKQFIGFMDFIEKTGNMIESLPKVAGVKAMEGTMHPREMRSFVRKYVGSPDFLAGGRDKKEANEIFLFANAIFQGVRSDYEIATQPNSRGAYWLKTTLSELLPKFIMLMATYGLFGEYLKELFGKISEYDKANYTTIPLGIDQNGKAVYFRLPSDETGRLIGGTFWKLASTVGEPERLAQLETYTDLLNYAGGQVPSLTPTITAGMNLGQFIAGNNPYDFFRGRPVLTDDQQQAGGWERTKPFLTYMFQQTGGNVFVKLYTNETVPKNPSLSEKISSFPLVGNILGRFIRASNYGEVEQIKKISNEVKTEEARERLANRRVVFDYVDRSQGMSYAEAQALKREMVKEIYGGFPKTPADRLQARNLEKRFDTLRIRGTADARVDALVIAGTNEEKVVLMREYQKTMSPEDFKELKDFIIKFRVVSSNVMQEFYRVEK